jgi:hypothetical protein
MDDFLRQRRFKPVDLYFRRRPVKEWVYERRLPQNANHHVRVYTTIQRYGGKTDQSRDVGKDAIRVQVIYRDEKGETLVSMPKRVNRVSTWRDNLDDRLKEIAESLPTVKMDRRGEPMTLRKKRGNLFWGSRDYPNYKETRRYGAEHETMIGKPGVVAWRAMNPHDYALGLAEGYISKERTLGRGFHAVTKLPNDIIRNWRGFPLFEIDMEGLEYTKGHMDSVYPNHIVIVEDIPIEKVMPLDSDLGMDRVSSYQLTKKGKPKLRGGWLGPSIRRGWKSGWFERFDSEEIRCCKECNKTTGLSTIQAGTYCYDCLPINLGAEDNYDATYGKKQAKIRRRLKNKIMKQNIMGTKANKWSARKSQELKRQYEKACEKAGLASYKGSKTTKQDDLSKWSKQKWTTASGKKSSVTGEPYFPEKAVAALKKRGLYTKAKRQKQKANRSNKNARYSDDIREVVGQFRAEYLNSNDPTIINILLLEWAMLTNETYDSITIQIALSDYIEEPPYDFVRHMQNQDLISLEPSARALVPAAFLYYLKDKDRDHWVNMKSRAIGYERYKYLKEKISDDHFWLSEVHKANYEQWLSRSAINYQNI